MREIRLTAAANAEPQHVFELLFGPLVRRIFSQLLDSVAKEAGRRADLPAAEKGETQ